MIYKQAFSVTGVANTEVLDSTGLKSTDAEKKRCLGIEIVVTAWNISKVQVWIDQLKLQEFYGEQCQTYESAGSTNVQKDVGRPQFFAVEVELDQGQTLYVGTSSGATLMSCYGCYVYEVI